MSKWCMADALDAKVKAINIVTLYANCLSDKFSELRHLFLIQFETNSTFHTSKWRGFGIQRLNFADVTIFFPKNQHFLAKIIPLLKAIV